MTSNGTASSSYNSSITTSPIVTSNSGSSNDNASLHNEMNGYTLDRLIREPSHLASKKQEIEGKMKQLALEHYQLFIDNYNNLNTTQTNMNHINGKFDHLLEQLPNITTNCEAFSVLTQSMTTKRVAVKNLLDNFPTILDLLEIPQLMDTCVKNASYDEALQLEAYTKKIAKQYPNIKILKEIVNQVQTISQSLISNLLMSLRGNVSLTSAIKTIGLLRRLGVFKENELKLTLLHSRDQWLTNSIKLINDSNPITYITKLTDCCRTNIFDIVTQFNAIFSDDSEDETNLDDFILYGWIQQKVHHYIGILETNLPLIKEGSSIAYIMENSMYYAMSMSRVGIDFRTLLVPIFEKKITTLFIGKTTTATHHFLEALKSFKFQPLPPSLANQSPSNIVLKSTSSPSHTNATPVSPPHSLLKFNPLAVLTNSFINSFIELKECAPKSLEYQLSVQLKDNIIALVSGVQSYYNQSTLTVIQEPVFKQFCQCIVEDFIPFIVNCFDMIYCNTSGTPLIDTTSIVLSFTIYQPTSKPNNNSIINNSISPPPSVTTPLKSSPVISSQPISSPIPDQTIQPQPLDNNNQNNQMNEVKEDNGKNETDADINTTHPSTDQSTLITQDNLENQSQI